MGGWNKSSCIAKKAVAALAASATLFCGLNFMSATPSYAAEGRDSFSDTIGNSTFETARQTYGLTEQMRDGATLHAWECNPAAVGFYKHLGLDVQSYTMEEIL